MCLVYGDFSQLYSILFLSLISGYSSVTGKLAIDNNMDISDLIDHKTGERKYLNREERTAFFDATRYMDPDIKFFARMIYYTGCRPGEALEVTPDKLDYKEKGVIIRTLKQNPDRPYFRFLELPDSFLESLHDVYAIQDKQQQEAGKSKIWAFTDRTGRNYIKAVMNEAGITGTKSTAKGLRHSMGVMLALDKVPLHTIQQILGHRSINNTRIYAEVVGEERRGMVSRVW